MDRTSSNPQDSSSTVATQTTAVNESRLVDNLIKQGLLDAKDLELARHYQNRMALKGRELSLSQSLVDLGLVEKTTIEHLASEERPKGSLETNDQSSHVDDLIRARTEKLQRDYDLLHVAMEITKRVISAPTLYELYQRTCSLISEYYGYALVSIFVPEVEDGSLTLAQRYPVDPVAILTPQTTVSSIENNGVASAYRDQKTLVIKHEQVSVFPKPKFILPDTLSELNIPVMADGDPLAILHVQLKSVDAFDDEAVKRLQTIIANIAPVIKYHHSINNSKEILGKLSTLYQASQSFSQARSSEEVYHQVIRYLKPLPYRFLILATQDSHWQPITCSDHIIEQDQLVQALESHHLTPKELENDLILQEYLLINKDSTPPSIAEAIFSIYYDLENDSLAIIPIRIDHQLASLILIYSENNKTIDENSLQFCVSLVDLASTSLQRIKLLETKERQLDRIEVLESINRTITNETDIQKLYGVIHQGITRAMGDVDLLIATYQAETNLVEIPYAFEGNELLSIPPFELGAGLTSILIKSKKPLLLVEDTERKAAELGAKVVGSPAKSWLGVPLLLAGEPIGAIIVQDLEREHRFDEEDQNLLATLSPQVASTIHNARLLHELTTRAKFEQDAIELTNKLWSVSDVESILQTAIQQIGQKLNASRGVIQLKFGESEQLENPPEVFVL